MMSGHHDGGGAAGQLASTLDGRDRPDPCESATAGSRRLGDQARHQHQAVTRSGGGLHRGPGLLGLQGEGDGHTREHDPGIQRKQG